MIDINEARRIVGLASAEPWDPGFDNCGLCNRSPYYGMNNGHHDIAAIWMKPRTAQDDVTAICYMRNHWDELLDRLEKAEAALKKERALLNKETAGHDQDRVD